MSQTATGRQLLCRSTGPNRGLGCDELSLGASTSSSELTEADAPALALAAIVSKNYSILVMYCFNVLVSYRDD